MMVESLSKYRQQLRRLILYCVIGVSGVIIDSGVFFLLLLFPFWETYYLLANAVSVTCGITNNFLLNAFFNFQKTDYLRRRFLCFFLAGLLGLGVGSAIIYLLTSLCGLNIFYSKIVSIFCVTVLQFLINYFVSFRDIRVNA